ncbi:hypothetical protein [Treponema primitia]|uniref:hypothetical protein n=1 Tax=Treponema primitia TaxID=88058 RepID=UPI0002554CFA|nr:hypothetical protein [Treponema primitia]
MKKRHSGGLRQSVVCAGLVLLCAALVSLTACDSDDSSSDGEPGRIISFSVGKSIGDIDQETGTIKVVVPADTKVNALIPDILLSNGTTIVEPVDVKVAQNFTKPVNYRVAAHGRKSDYAVYVTTEQNGTNVILSFAFGNIYGEIKTYDDVDDIDLGGSKITVKIPTGTAGPLPEPTIIVSLNSTATPVLEEDEVLDFSKPVTYLVEAANGAKRIYAVEVTWEETLLSLKAKALKTEFAYGEALKSSLVVTGYYSDGSERLETDYVLSDVTYQGKQSISVTKGDKVAVIDGITLANTPGAVSIDFLNDTPVIYGVTYTDGKINPIVISRSGAPDADGKPTLPKSVVISAGAAEYPTTTASNPAPVYTDVQWYYDGGVIGGINTANILTIYAFPVVAAYAGTYGGFYSTNAAGNGTNYTRAFAVDKTYYITFAGARNGHYFTVNIPFTVVR